jgi:perosamine synthetase
MPIPVNAPDLGEQEVGAALRSLRSGWLSANGPEVAEFERRWAACCDRRHGIAVSSGTAALQLAVSSLGLRAGEEVILPTFTIISCVLAVLYGGGVPVLVDADPRTGCIDVDQVAGRITARTRAVMPVHTYGHPVDMDPLLDLAQRHGLTIVEDAAEAHGAQYLSRHGREAPVWRRCGSFGRVSCFSFYANKLITTGEGGMLVTDDDELARKARSLRDLGFQPSRRFRHEELGFNFRLSSLQASLALSQIDRIDGLLARKRRMAEDYGRRLGSLAALQLPCEREWARSSFWMYGVVLRESAGFDAAELARRLAEAGVETRPFFLGMHEQPALLGRGLFAGERYPVAERLARRGLYLPSGLGLTDAERERVGEAVQNALRT